MGLILGESGGACLPQVGRSQEVLGMDRGWQCFGDRNEKVSCPRGTHAGGWGGG